MAALAVVAVEVVAGVELHARLGRRDVERAAARRLDDAARRDAAPAAAVQDEVVIVAAAAANLLVVGVDARADRRRLPEVERRAGDRRELAGRDQRGVDRREAIGVERQPVLQDVAASFAGQVEVAVLRQVDRRRLVGRRFVFEDQLVARASACR